MPAYQQRAMMEGEAFRKQVDKIKADGAFQNMMKKVGEEGVADAVIKGGSNLAEVFMKSKTAGRSDSAAGISEKDLAPNTKTQGLSSPVR